MRRVLEQTFGDIRVKIRLFLAGSVQNCRKCNLRWRIKQTSVGEETFVQEILDALPQPIGTGHFGSRLDVNEKSFDGPERIVNRELVVELLHEQQFIVENDVHCLVAVAFDVVAELLDRHVELFDFAGEVGAGGPEIIDYVEPALSLIHRILTISPWDDNPSANCSDRIS